MAFYPVNNYNSSSFSEPVVVFWQYLIGASASTSKVLDKGKYLMIGTSCYGRNHNCIQPMQWSYNKTVVATQLYHYEPDPAVVGSLVWDVEILEDSTTCSIIVKVYRPSAGNWQYTDNGFCYIIQYA